MKKKKRQEDMATHASNKTSHAFDWLIEFSKKVVFGSFILYLASIVFIMVILYINNKAGNTTGFELFISETNTTFKIVVGGYVIKATMENILKIGGAKYQELVKIKHSLYKDIMSKKYGTDLSDVHMEEFPVDNNVSGNDVSSNFSSTTTNNITYNNTTTTSDTNNSSDEEEFEVVEDEDFEIEDENTEEAKG